MSAARLLTALTAAAAFLLPAASASGEVLYGADGAGGRVSDLLVIDPATGNVTDDVGQIGFSVTGLAEDPTTGVLYGVTGAQDLTNPGFLLTVDERTGAGTLIGDLLPATSDPVADITFRSDGTLFGWSEHTDDLVTIDKATGAATVVGNAATSTSGSGVAFGPTGTLFAAIKRDNGPLYTVNPATGAVTAGPTMTGTRGNTVAALAFDSAGTLFGVDSQSGGAGGFSKLMTINTTTGELGFRSGFVQALDAIEFVDTVARTITLNAPKKVKKGKKATLSGTVSAPADPATCADGQTVEIQRRQNGAFETIATTGTSAGGPYAESNYSAKLKVAKKTTFRAVVDEPPVCEDATSPAKTVKVKKKHKHHHHHH